MQKKVFLRRPLFWLSLFIALLILTPFSTQVDLYLSHLFYTDGHFVTNSLTQFFFRYGEMLGFIVAGTACFIFLFSWFIAPFKFLQKASLALAITWVLGAGLIINTALKDSWGRARPRQTVEFGGKSDFRPYYKPDFHSRIPQKSFPSGHAATGFYYFSLALVGARYRSRLFYYLGLALAFGLGTILSICRIAQGAHFFTDTLFAAILMALTALFADWLVFDSKLSKFLSPKSTS